MRKFIIGAALLLASVGQAQAFGVSVKDFKTWAGDPTNETQVESYLTGLVEGEVTGVQLEAMARNGGDPTHTKAACFDQSDKYSGKEALADVWAYLKKHPDTPDDWLVGTVLTKILAERYRC